ncbi:hypothetical protein Lepto7376_1615 [[Leptolyngbya] sp. PCC 7376]|uniref:hypothetical protein n=1 Tax=[Leptolyngbya] sp. PCC 7376 TaxID=111781 RepID=UPI00029EFAA7|nr:hypothetical protein [[Leptolyngbya] sp. PCC 7376]AFY37951.1 hypothetical protein Lepto7376_1615 [[Leptolyngbya] sp. PCC 7376]
MKNPRLLAIFSLFILLSFTMNTKAAMQNQSNLIYQDAQIKSGIKSVVGWLKDIITKPEREPPKGSRFCFVSPGKEVDVSISQKPAFIWRGKAEDLKITDKEGVTIREIEYSPTFEQGYWIYQPNKDQAQLPEGEYFFSVQPLDENGNPKRSRMRKAFRISPDTIYSVSEIPTNSNDAQLMAKDLLSKGVFWDAYTIALGYHSNYATNSEWKRQLEEAKAEICSRNSNDLEE